MSDIIERSNDEIGVDRFQRAMDVGDFDVCLSDLRQGAVPEGERAALYCRLSEALYHRGDREEAVVCARAAFGLRPETDSIADFCAWLFSNCERHDEAAAAYERLIESRPGWAAGHRHASGSLAAVGQLDRAIFHGTQASRIEPGSFEFAFHAGCLLEAAGRYDDAAGYFTRAGVIEPANCEVVRRRSAAASALGQGEQALELAQHAVALAPGDRLNAIHLTELLLQAERYDEAAGIILAFATAHQRDDIVWRLLSETQMRRGRAEEALDAINRALALAPEITEYHLRRGNLLYRLGRFDEAADAFERAARLDPSNVEAKRSQLTVYFDGGRFREALVVGGELIRTAPDNEEYAQAVLQVLNRRFEALDGEYVVLTDSGSRAHREPRPPRRLFDAVQTQRRVIHALIIRETRTRFGDSYLGYGWALLEPILHISMLSLVFAVLMHGQPPIGTQFFIFYYTGIIPYHLFVHTSSSMTFAIASNGALLQLPLVSTFDVIIARGLLELVTDLLVAMIMLAGFLAIGIGSLPHDCGGVAAAIATVWLLGCGFGFINAVVNAFFRSWDKIWAQLTRILYFCSGIFYVPGMMPDWVRHILAWNPLLHAVDWFRLDFFPEYQPYWLDRGYLAAAAAVTVVAGLALERVARHRLYEPQ